MPAVHKLYNTALLPVRLGAEALALWRGRNAAGRAEWRERLARDVQAPGAGTLWLHGASVGEARIVTGLATALRKRLPERPLAASCMTATGRAQLPGPPLVDAAFFAPLDFPGLATRVLTSLDAAALMLVETELWPNWLTEARRAGVPVAIVNGRLSEERMSRYRRFAGLYRPLLEGLAAVGAQSSADAERFVALGLPAGRVEVTGNVKYDLPLPVGDAQAIRAEYGLKEHRPVIVAGSTGLGEDEQVLDAFARVRSAHPDCLLVLAPRHPERCDDVAALVEGRGFTLARFTRAPPAEFAARDVLLVDTVGQLSRLYRLATVAFVGGSLVPVGGHNVLEPAALGLPVLFGPHTGHVAEPATALLEAGGARRVADRAALGQAFLDLLGDAGRRARMGADAAGVLARNRGALERSVALTCGVVATFPAAQSW